MTKGMITGGDVFFANRFVQGRKFIREQQQKQPLYRTFGTSFRGDRLKRGMGTESPYNVSVFRYGDRLMAFGEQSLPMELDPVTLETKTPGRTFDFGGTLNDVAPFSGHPKIDSRTGELLNFGVSFNPRRPELTFYQFDSEGSLQRTQTPIDLPCSVHDFAASEHFVVVYLSPYVLDVQKLIVEKESMIDSLSWEPGRGSQLLVLERDTGKEVARIPVGNR